MTFRKLNNEAEEFKKEAWELQAKQSWSKKIETVLKLYSLFGLLIAAFSGIYFLLITLEISLSSQQQIALIISGTGLGVSIASWVMLLIRKDRIEKELATYKLMSEISELVWKWASFEELSKNILIAKGKDFKKHSIKDVIIQLYEDHIIDLEDTRYLEDTIHVRNMAVHGQNRLPEETIEKYSRILDEVISKLESSKAPNNQINEGRG